MEKNKQEFIEMVGAWAKKDMEVSGVLASITIAQAILESGWGSSELALHANNFFGMKTSLSGNTWESVWDGESKYTKPSPEQDSAGNETMKVSDFRAYPTIENSIRDHSLYLTGAKKAGVLRFQGLAGEKDYRKAAQIIRNGGYATDIKYVQKVCNIVEEYGLTVFDKEEKALKIMDRTAKRNPCYKAGTVITPGGGMIHSVGCPQPDPEVFASIWNSEGAKVCVHAVAGKDGNILQLLPFNIKGWHCGSGNKGSGNNTHIGVEMCEPACITYVGGATFKCSDIATAKTVVERTYKAAVELFAMLCKQYGLNPLADGVIISHREGHARGIASNHGDPEHLWSQLEMGYTMDTFRKDVKSAIGDSENKKEGIQASVFAGLSEKDAVSVIGELCREDMKKSGILASISAAQFILESGYGKSELGQNANNMFGMKKSLSGNIWTGSLGMAHQFIPRRHRNRMPMVHMKPSRLISGSILVWRIRLLTIQHICFVPRMEGHFDIRALRV